MTDTHPKPPISLLMVTNALARGGAEVMLVRLALALDPAVVRPVVMCLKEKGPLAADLEPRSIPVHEHLLRCRYDVSAVRRLSRLIDQYRPACMIAVGNGGDRMFWSALAARRARVPMIVWAHIFPWPDRRTFEWLNRRLYGYVDAFVALGQSHRQALIDLERIPADRIHVIRNGIDASRFEGGPRQQEDGVVVGIVANLRPDKRHDIFIDAAARVHQARPATGFLIIGDGPERGRVQGMVSQADPDGSFITMLGERGDVDRLLREELDIVCLTSDWHECLSIAMLEAMAAGRAFVSSKVGSLDEALLDRRTGRFFEPLSAEALAGVLIELIDDPQQREELGRRAQQKVREEFTAGQMARAFERLVVDLCTSHEAQACRSCRCGRDAGVA